MISHPVARLHYFLRIQSFVIHSLLIRNLLTRVYIQYIHSFSRGILPREIKFHKSPTPIMEMRFLVYMTKRNLVTAEMQLVYRVCHISFVNKNTKHS